MRCPVCRSDTTPTMSRCVRCNAPLTDAATTDEPTIDAGVNDAPTISASTSEDAQAGPAEPWNPELLRREPWPPEPWQPEPTPAEPTHTEPTHTERAPTEPWRPLPSSPGGDPTATSSDPTSLDAGPETPSADPGQRQTWQSKPWEPEPWQPEPWRPQPWSDPTSLDAGQEAPGAGPGQAQPWRPDPWGPESPDPGTTPWEPGTLGTEPMPSDQPWRVDPAVAAAAARSPGAAQAYVPPRGLEPPAPWHPPPRPKRRFTPLLLVAAAIVLVAAVVAVGIAFWPTGGATPQGAVSPQTGVTSADAGTPTPQAAPDGTAQATEVNSVLDDMAGSRSELGGAMSDAASCSALADALPTIQKVVGERERQLAKAKSLEVGALESGDQLKDALTRALQASLDADRAYLKWATNAQGCSGDTPVDSDLERGDSISADRASPAKREFLALWAPIARKEGQPARDRDHI